MGAGVLHEDSVLPIMSERIPVIIKSTLDPSAPGTRVVYDRDGKESDVCGIAGRKGFSVLRICKTKIAASASDAEKIMRIFAQKGIYPVCVSSGVDCISFTVPRDCLTGRGDYIRNEICACSEPSCVTLGDDCALIAIVGADIGQRLSEVFSALDGDDIPVISVDAGSGDGGITVGVREDDLHRAIKALYRKLIK